MAWLSPTEAAAVAGVSADTVRRWGDDGRLPTRRDERGRRRIAGADLARFLVEQAGAAGSASGLSARNRFRGIVTRVTRDGVAATVEVQAGPHRVVALITAEAVDELGLEPGVLADAAVKATDVLIDRAPT